MKPLDHAPNLQAAADPHAGLSPRNLTVLFLGSLTIMAGATISPSLPAIEAHFAGTPNAAILTRLVLTIPALFIALCAPLAGFLADRYGRRPVALGAVAIYCVAGLSGLVVDTLFTMLIGRAALGVAVAGIMTAATALLGDYFSGPARDRFMGLQATFIGLSGLVFLTSGGLFAEFHWRAPFLIYGLALVLIPAILVFIGEPARRQGGGETQAAAPPRTASLSPLILPLAAVFFAAFLNSVVFYLVPTQLPFYLRTLGSNAPTLTGLAMGAMTLMSAATSFYYGRVRARLSVQAVFGLGFAVMAAGLVLAANANSYAAILPATVAAGAGLGLIMPNLGAASLGIAPEHIRGRVSGGLTASIFLGQFVSPLLSQPAIARFGFAATYGYGAVLLLLAACVALVLAGARARAPALR